VSEVLKCLPEGVHIAHPVTAHQLKAEGSILLPPLKTAKRRYDEEDEDVQTGGV
jgi:hypothetical protein